MENFKLNNEILEKIKKVIDKNNGKKDKPKGLSQLKNFYADGYITRGQAEKILTFYRHSEATPEYQEKKQLYDEIGMKIFAENNLNHVKNVEKTTRKIKQQIGVKGSQTGRAVNRMNPTMASIKPPKLSIPKMYDLFEEILSKNKTI